MKAALTLAAALPTLAFACVGDDDQTDRSSSQEEMIRQIAGIAELAANAYASAGPEGLYDYLMPEITQRCSTEALAEALKDEPVPDGFRRLENVQFERHVVRATVVQLFGEEEAGVEWSFWYVPLTPPGATPAKEDPVVWRIDDVPGLERCDD